MDVLLKQQLDGFLKQHEQSAYKMALALIKHREEALEIVQDSMLKLVQNYANKPQEEWVLLFFRIVQNKVKDHHRQKSFRSLFQMFLPSQDEDQQEDLIQQVEDVRGQSPDQYLQNTDDMNGVLTALSQLPLRQKQTFILRAWQELSVKETAFTLNISEGSVKTHYSRALAQLKSLLGTQYEN